MFKLGKGSKEKLSTVHPDLQLIFNEAIKITHIDFGVTEGIRSKERGRQLQASGS